MKGEFEIKVGTAFKKDLPELIEFEDEKYNISHLKFFVTDDRNIIIYDKDGSYMPRQVIRQLFVNMFGEIDLMVNDFQIDLIRDRDFDIVESASTDERKLPDRNTFLKECVDYKGLRDICFKKGFRLGVSAKEYLKMYSGYQLQPGDCEDIREDVYTGTTCFPSLISEYLSVGDFDKAPIMDELHRNGIIAGFICFAPEKDASWENTMEYEFEVVKLRDELIEHIMEDFRYRGRRRDIVFIEGATGVKYGYLDFLIFGGAGIIINSAQEFFKNKNVTFAAFKTFRKISGAVALVSEE